MSRVTEDMLVELVELCEQYRYQDNEAELPQALITKIGQLLAQGVVIDHLAQEMEGYVADCRVFEVEDWEALKTAFVHFGVELK